MRRINETDIRKSGLVPNGHFSTKTAIQLFTRLAEQHQTINVKYEHCINCHKRQWQWKYYRFIGLEGSNCLLKEILLKPLSEEKKEEFKRKLQNNEPINMDDYAQEEYLSEDITKISAWDIAEKHDAYQAGILVD